MEACVSFHLLTYLWFLCGLCGETVRIDQLRINHHVEVDDQVQ